MGGSMPATLVSLTGEPSILLDKPILLIGRHQESDIQIDSRKISRRHCCIAQIGDYLVIRDLGSTNGVRVNGVRVVESRLNEHDEVTIGGNQYRVSWSEGSSSVIGESKHPAKERSARSASDDVLESCDEPVALPDPGGTVAAPLAGIPVQPFAAFNKRRTDVADDASEAMPAEAFNSPLIPENLRLAPSSDMKLNDSRVG